MFRNIGSVLAIALLGAALPLRAEEVKPGLEGSWIGSIAAGGMELPLVVKVKPGAAAGELSGTADSPKQGARDIPLTEMKLVERKFSFKMPAAGGSYEGHLNES